MEPARLAPSAAGLILAGGIGRRWGGPKAWAQLPDGRRFIDACTSILREAGLDPVLATLPPGSAETLPKGCAGLVLPRPGLDMFASLRLGLAQLCAKRSWQSVVVLPVDHPLVQPRTIRLLVDAGPPAAQPCFEGHHGHPLTLSRTVAEGVATGRVAGPTLREVLRSAGALEVVVDDPGVRANCNTPEALATACDAMVNM